MCVALHARLQDPGGEVQSVRVFFQAEKELKCG